MIDQFDARLKVWVETVAGGAAVTFAPPRDAQTDPVVHLYLYQIVPTLSAPDVRRSPQRVMLHYLVAVRAADPQVAHKLLGNLVFAAFDNPDFQLDFDPLPLTLWQALGAEPQPAFVLRLPLVRELPVPQTQLVRQPLVARISSTTSLQGVVLSENDVPIYGALVELAGLHLLQRTDSHGRFRFGAVPADPAVKLVRVTAKGQVAEQEVEQSGDTPVVIRFPNP